MASLAITFVQLIWRNYNLPYFALGACSIWCTSYI